MKCDPDPEKRRNGERYLVAGKFQHQMNGYGMQFKDCRNKDERICCDGILTFRNAL